VTLVWYRLAADAVVLVHFAFIAFVFAGGFAVLKWPRLAWAHVPVAVWGATVELTGWICPLTPLEVDLRVAAGVEGYAGSFVEHYILPIVYPPGLTRTVQWLLGALVIGVNGAIYGVLIRRARRRNA
jgi:hypothetical protein